MVDFDHLNHISHTTSILDVLDHYEIHYSHSTPDRAKALCPFHNDHDPSLIVYTRPDNTDESYYCYACNAGGDPFQFIRDMEGDFNQAWGILCLIRGIDDPEANADKLGSLLRPRREVEDRRSITAINSQLSVMYRQTYYKMATDSNREQLTKDIDKRLQNLDQYLGQDPSYADVHQYFKHELARLKQLQLHYK